jgi:hypothetical protein
MRREEKLRESMVRYLEGSLPAEEVEKLNQAVEFDWAARREMAELMLQETLLSRIGQESEFFELDVPKSKPERRTTARFNTTTRIMRSVDLPIARHPSRPKISGIVALAAATLFAVSVGVAVKRLQPEISEVRVEPVITVLPEPPVETVKPAPLPEPPPTMRAKATPPEPPIPAVQPPLKSPTVRKPVAPVPAQKPDPAPLNPAVQDGILIQPAPEIPPPMPTKTPPKAPPKKQKD